MSQPVLWETDAEQALWESTGPVLWLYTTADNLEISGPIGGPPIRALSGALAMRALDGGDPRRTWEAGEPTLEP